MSRGGAKSMPLQSLGVLVSPLLVGSSQYTVTNVVGLVWNLARFVVPSRNLAARWMDIYAVLVGVSYTSV